MASKVVKQLAGNGSGQSLADRVSAAKFSLAGSGLGRGIIKATTEELVPPKKKHLDYLTNCTNEVNVSIPELAELLVDRTLQPSWVVVMKAFITTHHLMNFGNEKFSQYMAAKNNKIHLPTFVDKTSSIGYEMSQYIKVYSKYVNEKCVTYRTMAFDFCKIKRGRDDGVLRRMPLDKLMKSLPVLQGQIDVLLEFDATTKDLSNPVLLSAFTLLYKDLIRLYASLNEGMINLIEQYFTMRRSLCRDALGMYKGFLERTEKVNKFVTVAEGAGVGDKASLGLQAVPPKVLQTLENHLANLEKRGKSDSDEEDGVTAKSSSAKVNPKIKEDIAVAAEKAKISAKPKASQHPSAQQRANHDTPTNQIVDNLLDGVHSNEEPDEKVIEDAPVRTQLRRPEQQHSVAVTVNRTGRSPSPARPPPRPTNNAPSGPSRETSPARPQSYHHQQQDDNETDLFSQLHSEPSNQLDPKGATSPMNGRASPFASDEKPIEESGSFWTTTSDETHKQTDPHNNISSDIDFESAFAGGGSSPGAAAVAASPVEPRPPSRTGYSGTGGLLELDLLGLVDSEPQKQSASSAPAVEHQPNMDDLLGFGDDSGPTSDNVLAPSAMQPQKPMSAYEAAESIPSSPAITEDDLLGALAVGLSKDVADTHKPATTHQAKKAVPTNTANSNSKPATGLDDTLAALAQSLGKSETKWSSSNKPATLAGKTRETLELSSGPTINWSANKTDSSVTSTTNATSTSTANNNVADILDLFG